MSQADVDEEAWLDSFVDNLRTKVQTEHQVIAAPADDRPCMLAYTVGLTEKGHPELAVYGLDPHTASIILNRAAEVMVRQGSFEDGAIIEKVANMPLMAIACDPMRAVVTLAMIGNVYGMPAIGGHPGWRAMQIVLPDSNGCWPFDAASSERHRLTQCPLLGSAPRFH